LITNNAHPSTQSLTNGQYETNFVPNSSVQMFRRKIMHPSADGAWKRSTSTYQIWRCHTTQIRNPISYPRQDVISFWVKSLFIMPNICFRLSIAVGVLSRPCGFLWVCVNSSNKHRSCIKNSTSRRPHTAPMKHTSSVRKQFPLLFAVCIRSLSWRSLFSQTSYCPYSLCHTQPT
jgi:hypothetical protein